MRKPPVPPSSKPPTAPRVLEPAAREAIHQSLVPILDGLPRDYPTLLMALRELRSECLGAIAKALQRPLETHAAAQPQNTLEERQALASQINSDLRSLGLALRSPNGRASRLIADVRDAEHDTMRYRFIERFDDGSTQTRRAYRDMPVLEPMEASPRVEPLAREYLRRRTSDATRSGDGERRR